MLNIEWCAQIIHDRKLASQGCGEIICVQQRVEQHSPMFLLIDSFISFLLTITQIPNSVSQEYCLKGSIYEMVQSNQSVFS